MKFILIALFGLNIFFVNAQNNSFLLKFDGFLPIGNKRFHQVFYMDVPATGKVDNRETLTGDFHKEIRVTYPDSSVIYISNNSESGSRLNFENRYNSGFKSLTKSYLDDSLNLEGVQVNGSRWREHYCGYIVVGYLNVSNENKKKYDDILSTLRRKQRRKFK
jgi:hypothetical protein